jgi:hypothetical protein
LDNLIRHVREQFYCADPVSYKKVWRSIRTSKSSKIDRAYAIGMYTNSSGVKICQACKQSSDNIQVDQIANYGIEMPQLNLCMCNNCAAKYKAVRDGNKDIFGDKMRNAILSLDISAYENECVIQINADLSLHFTQTHVAELQEIFRLLDEYGVPSENVDLDEESRVFSSLLQEAREETQENNTEQPVITETQLDNSSVQKQEQDKQAKVCYVAREGCHISYKKCVGDGEIHNIIMQPDKYPLHKAFEGLRVGNVIGFMGKQYEIIKITMPKNNYAVENGESIGGSTSHNKEVKEKALTVKTKRHKQSKKQEKRLERLERDSKYKGGIYVVKKGKISSVEKDDSQIRCPYCKRKGLFAGKGMCWDCYKDMMSSRYD